MAITKERRAELMTEYLEMLQHSDAIFWAEYKGIETQKIESLRDQLRKSNGVFSVTKNTVLRIAIEKMGNNPPTEMITGQLGTTFAKGNGPALAKTLLTFAKTEERFVLRGGMVGNRVLQAEDIDAFSKLPPIEELRAQILGVLQAPAGRLAGVMASGVRQLVNVVDAYAKKEQESEAAN